MKFFSLVAIALVASSAEAATVHNQAHAKGIPPMHGPHTKQQLAQVKTMRASSHGPLEKPVALAQQKSKMSSKQKNSNKAHQQTKDQAKWGDNIDWENVADRGNAAYNAAFRCYLQIV